MINSNITNMLTIKKPLILCIRGENLLIQCSKKTEDTSRYFLEIILFFPKKNYS